MADDRKDDIELALEAAFSTLCLVSEPGCYVGRRDLAEVVAAYAQAMSELSLARGPAFQTTSSTFEHIRNKTLEIAKLRGW